MVGYLAFGYSFRRYTQFSFKKATKPAQHTKSAPAYNMRYKIVLPSKKSQRSKATSADIPGASRFKIIV